ncbi:MAG: hypothetical protein MJB57_05545 [Gemmatimonadetes bacterium]|nr:hypothetical protein [Gemmatimonadota bacterium]
MTSKSTLALLCALSATLWTPTARAQDLEFLHDQDGALGYEDWRITRVLSYGH